jgi:streptogramin lyase
MKLARTTATLTAGVVGILLGLTPIVAGDVDAAPACVSSYLPPSGTGDSPFGVSSGPGGTWYGDGTTINKIHNGHTQTYVVPGVDTTDYPGVGWLTRDGSQIWFAVRSDGRLGTITGNGTIHTIAVPPGPNGPAVPQGIVVHTGIDVWFTDQANDRIGQLNLSTDRFTFFAVPSEFPLGLVQAADHDLYFTERSVDKVARLDPRTGLFTEWTLPAGSFPNRLATTPDGSVWFTALFGAFIGRIKNGQLTMYPVTGGPVGLTFYNGHLWAAMYSSGQLAEISLHGVVLRTWDIPDQPLQVAASDGHLWLTGAAAVWSVSPNCG